MTPIEAYEADQLRRAMEEIIAAPAWVFAVEHQQMLTEMGA